LSRRLLGRTPAVVALLSAAAVLLPAAASAANLTVVSTWGTPGSGPGQFNLLTDIVAAPDGSIYTLENGNDRVQRFSATGQRTGGWGSTGSGAGQFQQPEAFTVSPAGDISVADAFLSRVQRFDAAGTLTLTWGILGSGPGQMNNPEGIAATGASTVYIADRGNTQIDQYDATTGAGASFVRSWGSPGAGPSQFTRVLELAVDNLGNVYAVDRDNGRVQQFTADGTFIRQFGTSGTGAGQLSQPSDVTVDPQGNVYVTDHTNFKVVKFAPDGTLIADYDRVGGQAFRPEAAAIAPNGDLYVADVGTAANTRVLRLSEVPPPTLGKTVVVSVIKGTVLIRLPGSKKFVKLAAASSIPVGAVVDATKGTVQLVAASSRAGATQTGQFYAGVFKVVQKVAAKPVTDLVLTGGSFARCPKAGGAALSGATTVRKLWGTATGKFRTTGRYSAATVRGTTWLTADRCDATLTKVTSGSVTVRDFVRKRQVVVKAPKSYLARR
jgi:sugar lactone lactonase YvrE